jgi:hypothetical protein
VRATLEQELQADGGLPGAGIAVDQIEVVRRKPAPEDLTQPGNAEPDE